MSHIPPQEVRSPRQHWALFLVILDRGAGEACYAIGTWDGTPVFATRWNGLKESPIGMPQSRGLPTWFVLDANLNDTLIAHFHREVPAMSDVIKKFFNRG